MGDPNGMHSLDCPVYLASMEALERRQARLDAARIVRGFQLPGGESTAAQLRQTQSALSASQADLTATRGQVVDLLYIIDAFQIESGADREAAYSAGIEAVRQLRADLTRAEQERDALGVKHVEALAKRDQAIAGGDYWNREWKLARAELVTARAELERLRKSGQDVIAQSGWIVARDGGRFCERCEGEVRRGEAYALEPGTGGLMIHVFCPDPAAHTTEGKPA